MHSKDVKGYQLILLGHGKHDHSRWERRLVRIEDYKRDCLAVVHVAAAPIMIALATAIGRTPAVHLNMAPEIPPAATAP